MEGCVGMGTDENGVYLVYLVYPVYKLPIHDPEVSWTKSTKKTK